MDHIGARKAACDRHLGVASVAPIAVLTEQRQGKARLKELVATKSVDGAVDAAAADTIFHPLSTSR